MARGRLGSGRPVLLVGGFVISAVAAALMSSHPLPSTPPDGAPLVGLTSTYGGEPLTALPSAFATGRPVSLTNAADVTRWAPVLRGTAARRAPKLDSAPVGRVPARTPEGTTNIVVADRAFDRGGVIWVRVGLAVLPNGTDGWLPRSALGDWSFVDTGSVAPVLCMRPWPGSSNATAVLRNAFGFPVTREN
jgi:hypothetical protein